MNLLSPNWFNLGLNKMSADETNISSAQSSKAGDDDVVWQVSKNATSAGLEGETVILDMEKGLYFGLNKVGSAIWKLVEQQKTSSAIIASLLINYSVDQATAVKEVSSLMRELEARGLIFRSPKPSIQ